MSLRGAEFEPPVRRGILSDALFAAGFNTKNPSTGEACGGEVHFNEGSFDRKFI
jgi:hypothetical protein